MGRRKNDTKTGIKIITTRLIEISMKVDDYVYKHIPISESDAEKYMNEVSAYKVQCSRDQRSLQVIEKLTRCMKAIIRDHQELINDTNHDNLIEVGDNRSTSISPVYSIPDEDRNQLTQVADERGDDDDDKVAKDIDIIDLTNIEDEDNLNDKTTTEYNVEVEIHRAAGETKGLKVVQHNASIPKNDNLISNKYLASNISKSQIQTCRDADRTCTINTSNQDANITQISQNKVTKTSPTTNITAPYFVMPTNSHHEVTKGCHILNNAKTSKVTNNKKKLVNSMTIAHSANSIDIKKNKAIRKTTDTTIVKNKHTLKMKKREGNITPVLEKRKKVPIYNKNVIDDLSWIEDIRYVREIAAEENDCKLQLEDDFWDNYYLPANWSDNEFS
ncbi:unnamed protein product [Spodoptera littoralis]|uniref:Uncharacterized protein n=1 Tax=Spodoptera littoralis TaxID=7109 RepID=A0A9P0IFF7_SPOLI|nr:unnamed protein product [Spodoptera littoralis]CAH1645840.1 unnamed protein product [Spodoptera littoralis]